MSKKTVLITGASRGIGKAILESLNNEYFIVGTGTSESSVQSILENINSMNIEGNAFKLDLGDSCLLYTSPSPRDLQGSRMPSSA